MVNERELITRLRGGDPETFTELYGLYVKRLYAFSLRIIKSPELAEDAVHDVFVKIWENKHKVDPERSFQAYLFTVAQNRLFNIIKRSQLESSFRDQIMKNAEPAQNHVEEVYQYRESNSNLQQAITHLPDRRKLIFELCHNEGLTYKQVAEKLGITDSTVNSQMVKALKSIKDFLLLKGTALLILLLLIKTASKIL